MHAGRQYGKYALHCGLGRFRQYQVNPAETTPDIHPLLSRGYIHNQEVRQRLAA